MTITTDGIVAVSSGLLVVFAIIGVIVRFVLLPYLRDHLVTPVAEVREQVKNTHETNLREDLDAMRREIAQSDQRNERRWRESRDEFRLWRRDHMAYSEKLEGRVDRLERGRPDDN